MILLNIVLFTVKSRDDGDDSKLGPKRNEMKTEMEHVIEHSCTSVYCTVVYQLVVCFILFVLVGWKKYCTFNLQTTRTACAKQARTE